MVKVVAITEGPPRQAKSLRFGGDVEARHYRPACSRGEQRAEHAHGGRLAGPVGTEKAVDLAFSDLKVQTVDCR
jgi:hypothetical protein